MSGIAGVIYSDGQIVEDISLSGMAASLAFRGLDRASVKALGNVGFVSLMSQDLPESENEILPRQSLDQRYLITFHGRLDNRKEIYDITGQSVPLSLMADSELVVAAYRVFGRHCGGKLMGDFAFAIWDKKEQLLFCCRDQMGVKPLFFARTRSFFAFATEIKALLTLPGMSVELNRERLADFLVCIATERRMTVFGDIFKLQPAHYLIFKNGIVTEQRYWQLEPCDLQRGQNHEETFFELFREAVRVRLRGCQPIGSFLSGGIDSSSIVCMASGPLADEYDGTLHTYTGIYPRLTQCDERQFLQSVLDRYPLVPNFLAGDDVLPEIAFEDTVLGEDEPFFAPHFFVAWHLMKKARENGIRILLDGHDGDSAFSSGEGLLPELAMQGRIVRLVREMRGFPNATYKRVFGSIKDIYAGLFLRFLPFRKSASSAGRRKLQQLEILSPAFLETTNVKERVLALAEELPDSLQKERDRHYCNVTQPFHAYALEFLERLSSRFGICRRFPAFDIRVISFCLSLPAEEKLKDGYDRYIVRKSLQSILPAPIRTRKGKTNFCPNLVEAFTVRSKGWFLDSYHNAPPEVYEFMNRGIIEDAMTQCMSDRSATQKLPYLTKLFFFLSLSKWMQKTGIRC